MGEMIAIASGKGGVGKTWLAATLAHALADLGRRVLLFDGDLGLANLDIQLGIGPEVDLGSVLTGRAPLEAAVRAHSPTGVDVICGRSGSGRLALLPEPSLERLFDGVDRLAAGYDHVLLDLAAGLDGVVRLALRRSHRRVVVTSDEPTALTDAYALIKVSEGDGPNGRLMIAVNFAEDPASGAATFDGLVRVCERFLGKRPEALGVLRRDPRVRDAIRHQTAFLIRHPTAQAAEDVRAMARRLAGLR